MTVIGKGVNQLTIALCFLLVFLGSVFSELFGLDIKYCYIRDRAKHESNQKLLRDILEEEIATLVSNKTPVDQAHDLSARITQIARAMLKRGFFTEAYAMPELDQHSVVSFMCFSLWEGEKNGRESIPLTFFVYVWPSKELALNVNPSHPLNCRYGSNIHSHPIPCAFAVLQGALIQNNYEQVRSYPKDRMVRFIGEDIFQAGEGEVDDLKTPFIHQLYNRGGCSKICISLHAYGLSTAEKVFRCFRETYSECSFDHVLLKE